jgi:HK97 gp10 family phage protein
MKLEGMEQLLREVERMGLDVGTQLEEQALQAGAEFLREKIEETVPVRTGNLKDNIIVSKVKNGSIDVGPNQQGTAFYGHFLEFGTSKAKAQPFMGPSLESNKQGIQDKMAEVIKRGLRL